MFIKLNPKLNIYKYQNIQTNINMPLKEGEKMGFLYAIM